MRPGCAMASIRERKTRALSLTGSGKPGRSDDGDGDTLCKSASAHHREELDARACGLFCSRCAPLILRPRKRLNNVAVQAGTLVRDLEERIERRHQLGALRMASAHIAEADDLGAVELHGAPRHRH